MNAKTIAKNLILISNVNENTAFQLIERIKEIGDRNKMRNILPKILKELKRQEKLGENSLIIQSVKELNTEEREFFKEKYDGKGKSVKVVLNKTLIGGNIIDTKGFRYDTSIKTKLLTLHESLLREI